MVQLAFYEHRGRSCKQLLKENDGLISIELHATDSWPFPTSETRWILQFYSFCTRWCRVTQISCGGLRKHTTFGRVKFVKPNAALIVTGCFDQDPAAQRNYPHFCLYLSTKVTDAEFHSGSLLSGSLQRGNRRKGLWETTHYALVQRKEQIE
ncbi:unnamed protein product [Echinostoma caproni]|uniref:DUF663 domain-containing protein n=1 Tax=Echinostoma caproni TaxID=27848 RepID=A0A183A8T3_9TREM|nr:unnamed protein product [Echinostoma caproni]